PVLPPIAPPPPSVTTTTTLVTPAPPPPPTTETNSPSFFRTFLIGIALILFGALLGVLAYRFLPLSGNIAPPAPEPTTILTLEPTSGEELSENTAGPSIEIPPAPTATPSSLLDLKWNMMTVKSPVSFFSSYRIYYPTTWSIKEYKNIPEVVGKNLASSTLTLQKGNISFSILQNEGEGTVCLYPNNSNIEGRSTRFGDFRSVYKDLLIWRWAESLPVDGEDQSYRVCEQPQGGQFSTATSIGFISLPFGDLDSATLEEFNYILEKIVILE
ncbi:MAG: hypothetical protein ACD_61C00261G0004, partial [uncultured bacterium]